MSFGDSVFSSSCGSHADSANCCTTYSYQWYLVLRNGKPMVNWEKSKRKVSCEILLSLDLELQPTWSFRMFDRELTLCFSAKRYFTVQSFAGLGLT